MTRYARASGSKASNERIPSEATPWHLMKQQLVENLSKGQEPPRKTKSAKELLEDKQNISSNTVESVHNDWAEFENSSKKKNNSKTDETNEKKKKQYNEEQKNQNTSLKRHINDVDNSVTEVKSKKHKKDRNLSEDINEEHQSNKKINESDANETKNKYSDSQIDRNKNNTLRDMSESQNERGILSKRQKRNMKKKNKFFNENASNASEHNNEINIQNTENSGENAESKGNNETSRSFNKNFANKSNNFRNIPNKFGIKNFDTQKKKRKPPKIRDDKEHKRRKPDLGLIKMKINGVEVEVVKFDGFPVKKEDADRLSDLKQKMIMKGIPTMEINAAMKLERRKAEKALVRIRKCVCFHCRKSGHNLSDCPELGQEQAGTGICFKCGSTEHTYFDCKVAKPTEFRYATCFICREQGHISKQCPDNPKGVYPQGGCCKICGDVTHLKKDCPDLIKEKEENAVTLNTIASGNIESLEENTKNIDRKDNKKIKKVVTF
ncbi:PREDICTED: peptidyl-prolyl cis-trans isomerase G-like [Habropoda laboriosa]|uniref:peptidyl-prolyl cis-trans isomerase G-like n=1 Tax=Habropoda laboriosa TaxID=597456 RepID=UPI00083E4271|nr:PREDICTED: peptidyl-prolyl cis-trans isomerase G-like [Habropoda laboriosa]